MALLAIMCVLKKGSKIMKKAFTMFICLALAVCLSACGTDAESGVVTTSNDSAAQNTTSSTENETTDTSTTSKTTMTSTATEPTPTFKNPKTDFKFGKYVAKYFDNNKQSYHVSSLQFFKDFEGVEYYRDNYYTKEYCKKQCQDRGEMFDEQNFSYEDKITVNGVTYYSIGDFEMVADAYKITETEIKVTSDFEQWAVFHLTDSDQITLKSTNNNRYAKVDTIFTLTEE